MKIILTTDTHFGYKKIIEYGRPENFEELIKEELLKVIESDDLLIHLGDVCLGKDKEYNSWFGNLNCRKVLVKGNHDHKSIAWYMKNGWDLCVKRLDMSIQGVRYAFTHRPIAWDGYFDVNYHGHFHDTDHRRFDPEFNKILSGYNKLLALEYTNYKPIILQL